MARNYFAKPPTPSAPLGSSSGGTGQGSYTAGDILVAGADGRLAKLATGSNAQVLTIDTSLGQKTKWATPDTGDGGGGPLGTLIQTINADYSTRSISFTLSGAYDTYIVTASPASCSYGSNDDWTNIYACPDGDMDTSNYSDVTSLTRTVGGVTNGLPILASYIRLYAQDPAVTFAHAVCTLHNAKATAQPKMLTSRTTKAGYQLDGAIYGALWRSNAVPSTLHFISQDTASRIGGTFKLYGVSSFLPSI